MVLIHDKHISKRREPENLKDSDLKIFSHEFEKEIQETILLPLRNIYILYDSVFNIRELRFYQSFTHCCKISLKAVFFRLSLLFKKKEKIDKAIWVTHNWGAGYFHWLTDAIPRILVTEKFIDSHPVLLSENFKGHPYITDSLRILGVHFIYYNQKNPLKITELLLPSFTAPTGNYNEIVINNVRKRFLVNYKKNIHAKKIYISREKASRRKILNEKELISVLLDYEFEIHYFENYNFEMQIKLMSETKYLVSIHGGGLTNMLFMQAKGKILELRNEGDAQNNCYFSLASALDLEYYYQLNKGNSKITQMADIEVDVEELSKNLILMTNKK